MKVLQTVGSIIAMYILYVLYQSTSSYNNPLSNTQTRSEIMEAIADDNTMSKQMIGVMIKNNKDLKITGNIVSRIKK
ncbi:MAG: hypothetical protein ABI207_05125 [Crocinitomicaceae bacterium]